jgi:hypothetical protein
MLHKQRALGALLILLHSQHGQNGLSCWGCPLRGWWRHRRHSNHSRWLCIFLAAVCRRSETCGADRFARAAGPHSNTHASPALHEPCCTLRVHTPRIGGRQRRAARAAARGGKQPDVIYAITPPSPPSPPGMGRTPARALRAASAHAIVVGLCGADQTSGSGAHSL